LSDIERDQKEPSTKKLRAIASALEMTLNDLMFYHLATEKERDQEVGSKPKSDFVNDDLVDFNSSKAALLYEYVRDNAFMGKEAELEITEKYLRMALGEIERTRKNRNQSEKHREFGVAG
jgi:transcriptional regulator with XRE-family HTH domain